MISDFRGIHFWEKRKREKKIREQIRKEAEIPGQVYKSAEDAFRMIADGAVRQEAEVGKRPASLVLMSRFACGMAAVLLVCVFANVLFPAQVRALPFVGSIFERIQKEVGYENLSEYAEPLAAGEEDEENAYTETNGGLTVSVSEIYADSEVIYLSMKLKSEEPFQKGFYYLNKDDTKKIDGKVAMFLYAKKNYSFMKEAEPDFLSVVNSRIIVEGLMVNENTYEFLWRIDMVNDLEKYRRYEDPEAVLPEEFTLDIAIDSISPLVSQEEGYRGPWNFHIPVKRDSSHIETVEIQETGETGAGLRSVEKTPFEITTQAITPGMTAVKVVVLDANGNKLPSVLENEFWYGENEDEMREKWRIEGRDVSSVEVFVLGRDFYENVYAAGLWEQMDWEGNEDKPKEEKLGTLLRKHAEYHRVIRFDT